MKSKYMTLFLIFLIVLPVTANHKLNIRSRHIDIKIELIEGYYTDLEDDGQANDIVVEYSLEITAKRSIKWALKHSRLTMTTNLELPSGFLYSYSFDGRDIKSILDRRELKGKSLDIDLAIIFFDHATEKGDYIFTIIIDVPRVCHDQNIASIVFDPPGGTGGPPPPPPVIQRL